MNHFRLGLDLGGTKIEGAIIEPKRHEIIFRERIPTEQEKGLDQILNNIASMYEMMIDKIKNKKHTLGLGTPGVISPQTGLLKNSNILCLNQEPLKKNRKNN